MTLYSTSVVINKRFERLLDRLLDFCFDDRVLFLYRKLCRYYFHLDAEATVGYVYAYKELWDDEKN